MDQNPPHQNTCSTLSACDLVTQCQHKLSSLSYLHQMNRFRKYKVQFRERDLQKSLEALRVPDLLWRREKRPFLLRKRLILARLAAGHVPASLPLPPARRVMQPKGVFGHLCAAPHLSSLPPKASTEQGKSSVPKRSHL